MAIPDLWPRLQVGDRVRLIEIPAEFSLPGYYIHKDTLRLYSHLVSEGVVLTVSAIDEWGLPWAEYTWRTDTGEDHFHSIAINHSGLELVQ